MSFIFLGSEFVIYGQNLNRKVEVTLTLVPEGAREIAEGMWLTEFGSIYSQISEREQILA